MAQAWAWPWAEAWLEARLGPDRPRTDSMTVISYAEATSLVYQQRTALEIHAEVSLHENFSRALRIIAEHQIVLHRLIQGWRHVGIHFLIV